MFEFGTTVLENYSNLSGMRRIRLLLFIILEVPFFYQNLHAQPVVTSNIYLQAMAESPKNKNTFNRYDDNGNKTGLWIEEDEYNQTKIGHYINGELNGMVVYYYYGRLDAIFNYSNGIPSGHWYYFGDLSDLIGERIDIIPNSEIQLKFPHSGVIIPDSKCYSIEYYPNGIIAAEGIGLFCGFGEADGDFWEYGEWKYYNEDGSLKKKDHL